MADLQVKLGVLTVGAVVSLIGCTIAKSPPPSHAYLPHVREITVTTVPLLVKEQQGLFPFLAKDFGKGGVLQGKEVYAFSPSTIAGGEASRYLSFPVRYSKTSTHDVRAAHSPRGHNYGRLKRAPTPSNQIQESQTMPTKLPTRQLGTTDLNITRVGFGAWATGGGGWAYGWGPQDDDQSIAAITRALELGVNWIDTAAVYGLGHSEEVVGRLLKKLTGAVRPYVFTKCGLIGDPKDPMKDARRILTPASIRKECEASLRRLGVERIDLYQIHRPDEETGTPPEESWRMMVQLQTEGKVRAIGVSNFDASLLRKIEAIQHVDSLQPPFSLIKRDAAATEIPWCRANRTGVIVYSPMQTGILTDSFSEERVRKMAPDDWRPRSPNFQTPKLERNIALRDALIPIARRHNTTVSSVAIAWTLAWPGVTGAIVGARSAEQVDGWIGGATLTLTAEDLDDIALAIETTGAGSGPTRPASPRIVREESSASLEAR